MKKIISLTLALIVTLAFSACSSSAGVASGDTSQEPAEASKSVDLTNQIAEGTIGDYQLKIVSSELGKDYSGSPTIVVNYEWTNNSDDAVSFILAFTDKAFQNGIECESVMFLDNEDSYPLLDNNSKEIKPGASLGVQRAYKLNDATTNVNIEVTEWITFDDTPPMVKQTFSIT